MSGTLQGSFANPAQAGVERAPRAMNIATATSANLEQTIGRIRSLQHRIHCVANDAIGIGPEHPGTGKVEAVPITTRDWILALEQAMGGLEAAVDRLDR